MTKAQPYNPLDKMNLARSIEIELLGKSGAPLDQIDDICGAGVYAIYYTGDFPAYAPIAIRDGVGIVLRPIYVGKAIPKGGRKGGLSHLASSTSVALASRLRQHAASIEEARNLKLSDFSVRHLALDDIWIPLGENMLIESFKPVWNIALDGFGNKDPGMRRKGQYKSPWDVVHPGRKFADKLADLPGSTELLLRRIDEHFAGKPLSRLPKPLAEQEARATTDAEDATDQS